MYSSVRQQLTKSLDLQISSLSGLFYERQRLSYSTLHALMKLFTINGVYINAFDKLKMT